MPKTTFSLLVGLVLLPIALAAAALEADLSIADSFKAERSAIVNMKAAERGPFSRIRWFCTDGTVLPPQGTPCKEHGGGAQHGEWSEETIGLRQQGYWIANILSGLDMASFIEHPDFKTQLPHILIEKFLVGADDGWILRRAQFYRGAIQEEGERRAARNLLLEMVAKPEWIAPRFAELRVAVRMLPHSENTASIQRVRQESASLSDRDDGFKALRAKIHGAPGAEDAASVRLYASTLENADAQQPYLELALEIDQIYQAAPLEEELDQLSAKYTAAPWLQELLSSKAQELRASPAAEGRFNITATLLAGLRDALPQIKSAYARLEILDLSLRTESENFKAASELRKTLTTSSRQQRAALLQGASQAAYGTGVFNARLLQELMYSLHQTDQPVVGLDTYLASIQVFSRAPGWATQTLRMFFFEGMQKLAEIEPLAMLFIQDQLRGSPLLFFSAVLDSLSRDANHLAGVTHSLFGEKVGVGFNALNQGLAHGILHTHPDLNAPEKFSSDGIYLLPETVAELPPVAGILTGGEGNPLSHVQLLARNLGIPNVTVSPAMEDRLAQHEGEHIVMAVSKSGLVEISAWSEEWNDIFSLGSATSGVIIKPDLEKLDLSVRRMLPLDELRATDSGAVVGPKAAKLGELQARYPGHVARGAAIPFGLFFQEALLQPFPGGAGTVFDWMVEHYHELAFLPKTDPQRAVKTEAFRAQLHDIIKNTKVSQSFETQLKATLQRVFGTANPPGIFIRSDTNVEDLAGFTGAGLNLTLPNVIGYDQLLHGITEVWASPFTARAFSWRQSLMSEPQHVYTSILLLESVAVDKSGVLVTQDIDTGDEAIISVAVNEGLGGAVDGQAAESLRISLDGSRVQVLATATAPWRRTLNPAGGLYFLPASGNDTVLQPGEIKKLIEFSTHLPRKFPAIVDDEGAPAPADVEFGFLNGQLRLFQIRPFLESKQALGIEYLQHMEEQIRDNRDVQVNMTEVPPS